MPCTGPFTSGASLAGFAPVKAIVRRQLGRGRMDYGLDRIDEVVLGPCLRDLALNRYDIETPQLRPVNFRTWCLKSANAATDQRSFPR
jgi:hypothetical protein